MRTPLPPTDVRIRSHIERILPADFTLSGVEVDGIEKVSLCFDTSTGRFILEVPLVGVSENDLKQLANYVAQRLVATSQGVVEWLINPKTGSQLP